VLGLEKNMANHRSFAQVARLTALFALSFSFGCSSGADNPSDSVTGTLVKSIGRADDGSTRIEYHLKSDFKWIRLLANEAVLQNGEPNMRVTVRGRWSANHQELMVDSLQPASEPGTIQQPLSSSAPKGRVAIFLIKDQTFAGDPFAAQEAVDAILQSPTSTSRYFQEASYGAFGLSGDVFGWYSADMPNCDPSAPHVIAGQVQEQAAQQDGFVTDNYRHAINILIRNGPSCFYAFGSLGAPDGIGHVWSSFNGSNVMAHEIGHNLGLHHANSFICTNSAFQYVPFGTRCTDHEYNDPYDAMGFDGFYFHFNSYTKSLQGWLPPARVRRVTAAGQFTIVPQETTASGIQSLLVPIPNTNELLHVEMRRQFGFDSEPRFNGAVLVRRVREPGLLLFTHLMDMSPDGDLGNASMQVGQVFQDPLSGLSIRLVSRSASQAVVSVAFNAPRCNDGVKNGAETDVDCGGVCGACGAGKNCARHRDCSGLACSGERCVASTGGLTGQYYSGMNFETLGETRLDKAIDFEWGNSSPLFPLPQDQFSVRWLGQVVPPQTNTYTFRADTDDGVRLWVNNQLIIDRWFDGVGPSEGSIALTGGQPYDIRMEYFENGGGAYARLMWFTPTMPLDLIPPTQLIPAVGCTIDNALNLGPRNTQIRVPSDACVKVSQYPSWWNFTNGLVTLQSGTGTFPVPATWKDACTGQVGEFTFTTAWQSQPIGFHTSNCPALIQLNGNGAPLQMTWW
jgi:hypothetical protein